MDIDMKFISYIPIHYSYEEFGHISEGQISDPRGHKVFIIALDFLLGEVVRESSRSDQRRPEKLDHSADDRYKKSRIYVHIVITRSRKNSKKIMRRKFGVC